jgi:hypothetical protein
MKVLFFAPHDAIWIHAFPEALVAEALAQQGAQIVYVSCGGTLNTHCIAMTAQGVPFTAPAAAKERICVGCRRNEAIIRKQFNLGGSDLRDVINVADSHAADAVVASLTPDNCVDLVMDGIEVGRIALYELLLQNKKTEIAFSDAEWARYLGSVRNAVLVLRSMQRVLASERPDRVVVYNALYSVNRIVCRLAELAGIPQYFLHAGDNLAHRLQTLILARGQAFAYYERLREKFVEIHQRPAEPAAMQLATDHFLEVARGRSLWAYSVASNQNVDLRQRFGVQPGQKIICATMSSDDERFSGEVIGALPVDIPLLFPRQVDWIRALVAYVQNRSDLHLIVRVHPREFPNKRESVFSEHAQMLKSVLSDLPQNVRVNWPTDNVSLYDLANVADVFTNAWSSAGKEMAWLGLPVVLYSDQLTLYPASLNYVGVTERDYFEQIERGLREGWSAERIRMAYRWCSIEYAHAAMDISESFRRSEHRSKFQRAAAKILRTVLPSREQRADCRGRARQLLSAKRIDAVMRASTHTLVDLNLIDAAVPHDQETECLRREVGRLVAGLYGPNDDARFGTLAGKLREFASSSQRPASILTPAPAGQRI